MDTQNLSIAIQAFIKKQSTNAAYYEENWNERKERKAYYQSFTKDKLLAMTEEDFLEYISRLWAVLMWGNKKYVVDKLIEDNGFSTLKKQLADLLYGSASVEKRWDIFLKSVKGMGPAAQPAPAGTGRHLAGPAAQGPSRKAQPGRVSPHCG